MENYILTAIGILVSILLFLIGYRQTIGAKKERLAIANSDIEKILIRRIVNENYNFNLMDIFRLIEGKARDYNVQMIDLLSVDEILNCIYTRIIETDFITQKQREEIINKIIPMMDYLDSYKYREGQKTEPDKKPFLNSQLLIALILATLASAMGTLFATYLSYDTFSNEFNSLFVSIATLSMSFISIIYIFILKRSKESQKEELKSSSSLPMENSINFEKEVVKVLSTKYNNVNAINSSDNSYDFIVNDNGKKILVVVKLWTKPVPNEVIKLNIERLNKAVLNEGASEGIIVTNEQLDTGLIDLNQQKVRLLTLSELKEL